MPIMKYDCRYATATRETLFVNHNAEDGLCRFLPFPFFIAAFCERVLDRLKLIRASRQLMENVRRFGSTIIPMLRAGPPAAAREPTRKQNIPQRWYDSGGETARD